MTELVTPVIGPELHGRATRALNAGSIITWLQFGLIHAASTQAQGPDPIFRTPQPEGAASFASLLVMPLWVLSGVTYPLGSLPEVVDEAVRYLPTTPLIDAARAISLEEIGIGDLGFEFSVLAGWLLASFMIASRTFRFTKW